MEDLIAIGHDLRLSDLMLFLLYKFNRMVQLFHLILYFQFQIDLMDLMQGVDSSRKIELSL